MNGNGFTGKFKTRSFKRGTLLTISVLIAVALFLAVNIISAYIPAEFARIDTTNQDLFSISEQTNTILEQLSDDITIYHLCSGAIEDENISELLIKYAAISDMVTVSVIDTSLYPNFYTDYTDESPSDNSLIVKSSKRSRVIDFYEIYTASSTEYEYYGYYDIFNGEKVITSAIDYVTTDTLPKIYNLEGHGEFEPSDELKREITNQNFDFQQLSLNGLESVPKDADCVMIFSPQRDISQTELDLLSQYTENGGNLLIIADYVTEEMPVFDSLLKKFGLTVADGIVFESDSSKYISSYPYFIYPQLISHTITEPLISSNMHILFPLACGIITDDQADQSLTIETLVAPSDSAYSKIDVNSENFEKTEEDISGPFSFATAVTSQTARMVLFSTSQFLDGSVNSSVAGANYDLFLNSMAWLCQKESSVSIHPKNLLSTSIAVGSSVSSIMFVVLVVLIPGIFIISAFFVMRKRKNS